MVTIILERGLEMATNQKCEEPKPTRTQVGPTDRAPFPSLSQLLNEPDGSDPRIDIALVNLVCANGLPRASPLHVGNYLDWLDEAAERVRLETERNYYKFLDAPAVFGNSQARFCMVCLVTVLQQKCGVGYNPKWMGLTPDCPIPESFGRDADDLFIHAIIDGIGGTCGSIPVVYVAVGRRLGYPLRLVKAARHLFVRWDDPNGKHWHHADRFNVEATTPGVHFLPDEHYWMWPHAISKDDVEVGIFLRSLSAREELAEFVATRGYCLRANGQLADAVKALAEASRLTPHNHHLASSCQSLRMHIAMRQRGHAFLNAAVHTFDQEPVGPFWMDGLSGQKVLVQIVSPVTQPFDRQPDVGRPLLRQYLQTPNGLHVEAWLPVQSSGSQMTAHWITLSDGRIALIHKPIVDAWSRPGLWPNHRHVNQPGHPIMPDADRGIGLPWSTTTLPHEQGYLASQIQRVVQSIQSQSAVRGLPAMQPFAISASPTVPQLSHSTTGIPRIN